MAQINVKKLSKDHNVALYYSSPMIQTRAGLKLQYKHTQECTGFDSWTDIM